MPDTNATELTPDLPLWLWAEETISHRAREMLRHLDGVREGADIEAVHDMRVGSRRVVAAMRVFHTAFPGEKFRKLTREAKRVTRRLGAVRDLDVLIDHLERMESRGPNAGLAREYLLARLRGQRERARKPMLAALDEVEKRKFDEEVVRFLQKAAERYQAGEIPPPDPTADDAEGISGVTPFREAAPPLLRKRLEALYEYEPFVDQPDAVEELHAMRIRAKWLRYTMELFAPAYPDCLERPIRSVKKIQELLGDLHDADVRLELLRESLSQPLKAGAMVELGIWLPDPIQCGLRDLHALETEGREGTYRAFYKEWNKQRDRLARVG